MVNQRTVLETIPRAIDARIEYRKPPIVGLEFIGPAIHGWISGNRRLRPINRIQPGTTKAITIPKLRSSMGIGKDDISANHLMSTKLLIVQLRLLSHAGSIAMQLRVLPNVASCSRRGTIWARASELPQPDAVCRSMLRCESIIGRLATFEAAFKASFPYLNTGLVKAEVEETTRFFLERLREPTQLVEPPKDLKEDKLI